MKCFGFSYRGNSDKTLRLPDFDIVDSYTSQGLLDGFLIIRALGIFRADPVPAKINR
jgi:hypothetical protein